MSSDSDDEHDRVDHVALLEDAISKVSDSNERRRLRGMFDYDCGATYSDQQLQLDFMTTLQAALDRQLPPVPVAKKSKTMKRRERLHAQRAREGAGFTITKYGVPRSAAQLMGQNIYSKFRKERRDLVEQIRITASRQ